MSLNQDNNQDSVFYEPYKIFATSLRAWFIAYGIGAPILFLSNEFTQRVISEYENNKLLIFLFLAGVILQTIQALLYKHVMWHLYMGEDNHDYHKSWLYKSSVKISEASWLEILFDLATVFVYSIGTWHVLNAFF
ncbi:MAG: hypothetical protein OEY78_02235 [Gammaproteobacteria bacterium]|nr:hypothetical protein [Gammaproteobacteria bacterium]